jgi:hypothetical protein
MSLNDRLISYAYLIRLDKPIGTLLLLWPTLWALWLASSGAPDLKILLIFVVGTFLMRSAGCAVNDYADRNFDLHVQRTQGRPVTSGKISGKELLQNLQNKLIHILEELEEQQLDLEILQQLQHKQFLKQEMVLDQQLFLKL